MPSPLFSAGKQKQLVVTEGSRKVQPEVPQGTRAMDADLSRGYDFAASTAQHRGALGDAALPAREADRWTASTLVPNVVSENAVIFK